MKTCSKCGEIRPRSDFHRAADTPDGLKYYCKPCMRRANQLWRLQNLESARASSRRWELSNPEKVRAAKRRRYWENPDKARAQVRARRRKNPATPNQLAARREYRLKSKYGLSSFELRGLTEQQGGRCKSCQRQPAKLVVDHNHVSGGVRGLLCAECNAGIGFFHDSPGRLRAAAAYLEACATPEVVAVSSTG